MSIPKRILSFLLVALVAIQFIRPVKNTSTAEQKRDITKRFNVPADLKHILKTSCYDCHSNNTNYPWYANIQPLSWLLANHIKEGKADLNFNEFSGYSKRRQLSKLKEVANSVKDGSMPLSSYTLLHKDALLDEPKKQLIMDWFIKAKDSLDAQQ